MPTTDPTKYWLMKSEPDAFSIEDLERRGPTAWDGVRNYQARNHLREAREGDGVLFYHSGTERPGVAGLARVAREAYPDPTQFDPRSPYHDPKATREAPRWFVVDVAFEERFPAVVTLDRLRATRGLEEMVVLRRGNRLSVTPVTAAEWTIVAKLGRS